MACRITQLVLDCTDARGLADFWCAVLGWRITEVDGTEIEIGPPEGAVEPFRLLFTQNGEPKRGKIRLHIDVNATDRDQDAELDRLLALGARQVDVGQGEQTWHVLADTEGNEFCLLRSRVDPL